MNIFLKSPAGGGGIKSHFRSSGYYDAFFCSRNFEPVCVRARAEKSV